MRLSDLLDAVIVDPDGNELGRVHDVRLVQDGPILGSFGAALSIEGLVFGKAAFLDRLGFDRSEMKGPATVEWIVRALHRHTRFVPWELVAAVEEGRIHVSARIGDLPEVDEL